MRPPGTQEGTKVPLHERTHTDRAGCARARLCGRCLRLRAGLHVDGVNFPGHFLVRCPESGARGGDGLIVDPFHGGALL